jgi:hypothetical protein
MSMSLRQSTLATAFLLALVLNAGAIGSGVLQVLDGVTVFG